MPGSTALLPLCNLARLHAALAPEIASAVERVLSSGNYISGSEVERFEEEWARYVGVRHAVGCSSGTDALVLILRALGIGPGDEVITVSHTFIATIEAIVRIGATPVLVDVRATEALIDVELAAAAMTPRTRALIAVHLYGAPADLKRLATLCAAHGVHLIEDCAQSHGATYTGADGAIRMTGSCGIAAGFSFYPSKTLGALGDAGAVTTNDRALAETIRSLREHGREGKHLHRSFSGSHRLDELQAAILSAKLPRLAGWIDARRKWASQYRFALTNVPGITLLEDPHGSAHGCHLFVIQHAERDALQAHLTAHDIQTGIHYPIPTHLQPAWTSRYPGIALPESERIAAQCLSLPLDPMLRQDEIERVLKAVTSYSPAA